MPRPTIVNVSETQEAEVHPDVKRRQSVRKAIALIHGSNAAFAETSECRYSLGYLRQVTRIPNIAPYSDDALETLREALRDQALALIERGERVRDAQNALTYVGDEKWTPKETTVSVPE